MSWQYTPYAMTLTVTAIVSTAVAAVAWRRRGTLLALLMLAVAEWALAAALEAAVVQVPAKIFWAKIQYLGITSTPTFFLLFALEYSRRTKWLTRRNVALLWVIPIITIGMAATNEWHGWLWNSFTPSGNNILIYGHGPWFWIAVVYFYLTVLVGTLALIWAIIRFPHLYRRQAGALVASTAVSWLGSIIYISGLSPVPGLDTTPIGFMLAGLILTWSIFRLRLFDLVPIARDVLVENMTDGVLVLDEMGRVVDINPAAQELIGPAAASAIGQHVETALAAWPDLAARCRDLAATQAELLLVQDTPRYLDLRISPLYDRRNRLTGRLIILRDITGRKQSEEALRDQRTLAEALRDTAAALNSTLDLDQVLDRILENVGRVVSHDAANIMLIDERDGFAYVARAQGYTETAHVWSNAIRALRLRVADTPHLQRMAETGQPVVISNTHTLPTWIEQEESSWLRSYAGAPIRIKDRVAGFLNLNSTTPGFFTQAHAERLQALADQAAIAIENARLFREMQQRTLRQALINEISVAINSFEKLDDVLQTTADGLARALRVEQTGIALFDERRQHLTLMAEHAAPGNPSSVGIELPLAGNLSMQRILETRASLAIADAQNDPLMSNVREIMLQRGVQSILIAPLIIRDQVMGTIGCDAIEAPRQFTPEEIELAQTIANLVAARIEQARLFEAERQARQQAQQHATNLSGLYAITRATSQSLALHDVLTQALVTAMASLGFEAGHIALAKQTEEELASSRLHLAVQRGLPSALLKRLDEDLDNAPSTYAHTHRQVVLIDDLEQATGAECPPVVAEMAAQGWRAYVGIPLIHQEQSLGVIGLLSRQPRKASSYDMALLNSIGHQVAAAAAHAHLFQDTLNERSRLRALIESSRDGIMLSSMEGHVLVVNAPTLQLLRLPGQPEEWLGRTVYDVFNSLRRTAPQAVKATLAEMRRLSSDESAAENEFEAPPRVIRWLSLPVRVGAMSVGRLVVLRDMTDERVVEQMREDMTHTMVHDLRNPLSGISASLTLLLSGATGEISPLQLQILDIAQRSSQQMIGLVNSILDVSRLESGRMPLERREVNLAVLVTQALQAQTALAAEKNIHLENGVPSSLPRAWADPDMIGRVLQNLVGNAIKFTPPGGFIRVDALPDQAVQQPTILVSVSDNGPGIPPEIQNRLFQKFVTGGQEGRGSGLGLAFCRLAVEAHAGRIWVDSVPGSGTTFTFSLAIAER